MADLGKPPGKKPPDKNPLKKKKKLNFEFLNT